MGRLREKEREKEWRRRRRKSGTVEGLRVEKKREKESGEYEKVWRVREEEWGVT